MFNDEDNPDNLEQFRIYSRREIISLLDGIRSQRQLVKMSANGSSEAILTSILAVQGDEGHVLFDAAPMQSQNRRFIDCDHISFETKLDQIRVLFTTEAAEPGNYQEYPALRLPLPDTMVRLQRREFYRVNVPRSSPVLVSFPPPGSDNKPIDKPVTVDMLNISMGGIAIVDEGNLLEDTPGITYEDCVLALPGGSIRVSLEVRNVAHLKLSSGKAVRHIGFQFAAMSNAASSLVQRFILKLERDHNAKMAGFR